MNNTAMAAILMAATLVVGTFATTTATTVFAASNNSGNTITIQKCKQAAIQSGWDNTQEEECANLICTHPGAGATCVSEGGNKTAGGGGGGTIDPCLNCFAILSADEQARFITAAVQSFGFNVKSIEDICRIIGTGTITVGQIAAVLQSANIPQSEGTHGALLIKCLLDAGLITNTDTT